MSFKILHEYGLDTKADKYNLMIARGANLMDCNGQRMEVKAYMVVEETRDDGEVIKAFKAIVKDGDDEQVVGTNSPVFMRGLETYLDFMGTDELTTFAAVQKPTRNNKKCLTFNA